MSLFVNDINIKNGVFPNNEIDFNAPKARGLSMNTFVFKLVFDNNTDLFNLILAKKYIDDKYPGYHTCLEAKFFPYGQMDREIDGHLFSLKYVAKIINDCKFDKIEICDPHSNVMPALLDKCSIEYPVVYHLMENECDYDLLFYPDNGACKKYSEVLDSRTDLPYRYGNKKRNLDTGEIIRYEVIAEPDEIKDKRVLIIDDLVMGGRTFREAAKALKDMGAKSVDLYVTHLMPQAREFYRTKGNGLINRIFSEDTLGLLPSFNSNEPRP